MNIVLKILPLLLIIVLTACSEHLERQDVKTPSKYMNKTVTTKVPLAYKLNLPRYNEVSTYIRRNSTTLFANEVDRVLTEIISDCVNCMGKKRLTTPIRLEYIPIGTKLTVVGEYIYFSDYGAWINGPTIIHMLIVQDELGNKSEISELGFKLDVLERTRKYMHTDEQDVLKNIEIFQHDNKLVFDFCIAHFIDNPPSPMTFFSDFKLDDEVSVEESNVKCSNGYRIYFKTLEAYLTAQYYFHDWSLYGDWYRIKINENQINQPL